MHLTQYLHRLFANFSECQPVYNQIERFLIVLGKKYSLKAAQMYGDFWAILKNFQFTYLNTAVASFGATFIKNLAPFNPASGHTGTNAVPRSA